MTAEDGADRCRWITPQWPAPAGVRALSTLRIGGVSAPPYAGLNLGAHVGDDPAAVAHNRCALKVAARLPAEPFWLAQVHGTSIRDLDVFCELDPAGEPNSARAANSPRAVGPADGAVTRQPGRVCAILTADCLPVLLTSRTGDRVGAAHAGWRGLAAGVIEAAVKALDCPPGEVLAWLGPAIGPRHFEVGGEVREAFLSAPGARAQERRQPDLERRWQEGSAAEGARVADAMAFVPTANGRFLADLYALARCRLARLGVERVYGGGECTFAAGDRYFSHRRDGCTGRQATLIWREAPPHR